MGLAQAYLPLSIVFVLLVPLCFLFWYLGELSWVNHREEARVSMTELPSYPFPASNCLNLGTWVRLCFGHGRVWSIGFPIFPHNPSHCRSTFTTISLLFSCLLLICPSSQEFLKNLFRKILLHVFIMVIVFLGLNLDEFLLLLVELREWLTLLDFWGRRLPLKHGGAFFEIQSFSFVFLKHCKREAQSCFHAKHDHALPFCTIILPLNFSILD